eukprot:s6233_g2.t1
MIIDKNYGKTCVICSANEISSQYHLWPPLNQRSQIIQMAARTKNLINKHDRDGNPVNDPHVKFLQFFKDITNATVGNKLVLFGEALLKALSHFGMVRVPRDRVGQIFQGKRGRQYVVIREEFHMNDCGSRFAYRVSKDYGNVFYKDYLKHVLGREFATIMGQDDPAAEKCGDVVEMWLGMLDIANMTKKHITFMETKADPGELLAGLEASIGVFQASTRSSQTFNTKRNKSKNTYITAYEGDAVNRILQECAIYKDLDSMCLIEDDEAEIISEIYANSKKEKDAEKDDPMGEEGQGEDVGRSTASGAASSSAGVDAERHGRSARPSKQTTSDAQHEPDLEEEFQISMDKGMVIDAIDALFATADDHNVCLRCGSSGHPNYECPIQDDDPVKRALKIIKNKLQGIQGPTETDQPTAEEKQPERGPTKEGEYMYLRPIALSEIGDRAHGVFSVQGV